MKILEDINCKTAGGQIAAVNNVTQKDIHRIAVVGGGPGGLSFCVQFYDKIKNVSLDSVVEILVFEKGKEIGTGLPYACEDDVFITNTPKCNHNVSVAYEGHFTQWLEDNSYNYEWTDFPPRHVFGKYLKAQAEFDSKLSDSISCPGVTFDEIMKRAQKMTSLEWLEYHIKLAESNNTEPWEIFLHGLFYKIPLLWSRISVEDQSIFVKKYHSLFLTYMAEFPLENAYKIRELLESGRLTIIGGVKNIEYEAKTAEYIVKTDTCDLNNNSETRVHYVVNATGPGSSLSEIPLYHNMMKHGLVVAHPSGGLYVDIHTLELQNHYFRSNSGIYALGELTKGHFLMTLCFSQVVQMADRVAHCISEKLLNEKRKISQMSASKSSQFLEVKRTQQKVVFEESYLGYLPK
ncbi:FAD-NAD(P)-binding domain-containing protein [Ditylenchus destructor]|nr:FAD-NAD(P)-binding domain-containing protein [Ditylenchus destructor]